MSAKIWEATYRPFGDVELLTAPAIDLGFPGQWFQTQTGLYQNWHRDYDPATGRYLQPDPLGLIDGPAVYRYALGNPVIYIDPMGLQNKQGDRRNTTPSTWTPLDLLPASKIGVRNARDMQAANTRGADKYFHCKAHCEMGQADLCRASEVLGTAKEWVDYVSNPFTGGVEIMD